jgi:very-short-patch-repair endonuclease
MSDDKPAGDAPAPRKHKPWTVRNVAHRDKILFAREQRREPTAMEEYLWERLRRQPFGCKFRRQHPIGDFVLDFYCAQVRLAIEIDGPPHRGRTDYDNWRDAQMKALGIRVWRVPDEEVAVRMPEMMGVIREAARRRREGEVGGET